MIIDHLENTALYRGLGEGFRRAFDFLSHPETAGLKTGRHEIDGERVYALIQEYDTKPREKGSWEAHRRYADIQCLARGREMIGYAYTSLLVPAGVYSNEKDCAFFAGEGNFLKLEKNFFAIFFPSDAHMPGIAVGTEPEKARKIVVKVLIQQSCT